jgi:hypothetical protein
VLGGTSSDNDDMLSRIYDRNYSNWRSSPGLQIKTDATVMIWKFEVLRESELNLHAPIILGGN